MSTHAQHDACAFPRPSPPCHMLSHGAIFLLYFHQNTISALFSYTSACSDSTFTCSGCIYAQSVFSLLLFPSYSADHHQISKLYIYISPLPFDSQAVWRILCFIYTGTCQDEDKDMTFPKVQFSVSDFRQFSNFPDAPWKTCNCQQWTQRNCHAEPCHPLPFPCQLCSAGLHCRWQQAPEETLDPDHKVEEGFTIPVRA